MDIWSRRAKNIYLVTTLYDILILNLNFWSRSLLSKGYQNIQLTSHTLLNKLKAIPVTSDKGFNGRGIGLT
jgi:hypothetical protein